MSQLDSNSTLADVLGSYVPKLIHKYVIAHPTPIDEPVTEKFQAAVLFADISGFTLLTERLAERGPSGVESLARILNEYFGRLIDIVHDYGGDVVKFAGDAVVAVWTVASSEEATDALFLDDQRRRALRAAECALKIRAELTHYKTENLDLYLKLAVSAGNIVAAHVGGEFNRWELLLTGNPLVEVGIANSLAKAGEILVAPSAWKLIRNDCIAELMEFELPESIAQAGRLSALRGAPAAAAIEAPIILSGIENALRPYIPGAIINRLAAGQSGWIAELRRVTVLFINLPGLNQDTKLDASQRIAKMLQRSVYRYEGSINKINVDDKGVTLIAAFGLPPFSHEDDPARGASAALAIRRELNALNVRSSIGIATGRIFCGSIGNESRREYAAIGNAVNLSARLMSVANLQSGLIKEFGVPILCDRATYDSAKDTVVFQTLTPQPIKGRSELVEVFFPLEGKKSVIRPKAELIGRREEKIILGSALQGLERDATSRAVILYGEAGIGKSRLFEELIRQAETLDLRILRGEGDAIERNSLYYAWRGIFHQVLGLDKLLAKPDLSEADRLEIQSRIESKLDEADAGLARYAPLLDVLLPTLIPDNELTVAMTSEIRASNTRETLARLLNHVAQRAPLLIVMEDLHWFDSASWELLVDVRQKVNPILLALNTRPLPEPPPKPFEQIIEMPGTQLVRLEAMPLDDVEAVVCQRLGVRSIPSAIGRVIREKSEGNPFFAEELAHTLLNSGLMVVEGDEAKIGKRFADFNDLVLPDTLQAAITNRIDSLDPSQQLALKVASVIGRIFTLRLLQAIYPIDSDKPSLPAHMEALTRLSLTAIESETPDLAYVFKHAVTQEAAYNLMLFSQRRQLHRAIAEWIEKSNEGNLSSYFPLLAYHWSQAIEQTDALDDRRTIARAMECLEKAGDQAMQNFANRETIQFFKQALEWEAKLPKAKSRAQTLERRKRCIRWHRKISVAYYGLGLLPDCNEHVREALRLFKRPQPTSTVAFAVGSLPPLLKQIGRRFIPIQAAQRGSADKELMLEMARLYELLGRICFYSNEALPTMYCILHSLDFAEQVGTSPELANAYSGMAILTGFAQLHSLAERYVSRALAVAEEVNQPSNLITVNVLTSVYQIAVGKWDEIRIKAQQARELCEQLGDYRQWGDALSVLAESAFLSGHIAEGLDVQKTLLEDARRRNSPLQIVWGLDGVAWNNIRLENEATAIPMLEEALQILEEIPNQAASINTHAQLALAHLRLGDEEKALQYADDVLKLAEGVSPTVYALLIGFSAVAQVYFTLWEKTLYAPLSLARKRDLEALQSSTLKALALLSAYKRIFPIGFPYLAYYRGWQSSLNGDIKQALKFWRKGLEVAQKFNLLYEEGLLRLKLAEAGENRNAHIESAIRIFETMDATRELQSAKVLWGEGSPR